jgi:heme exporter protein A
VTGAPPSIVPPLLQADSLERRFGALRVLRGVSLSVNAGECHLVVGPNGAGKSTLLRCLAGLARPSGGLVRLSGNPLAEPSQRRGIGFLSHQSHLYDDLSALENLAFWARLFGLSDPARRAESGLQSVGLADRAHDAVRRLSRGMVQRVTIARTMLHDPRLLLLDEPFTGLDPAASEQVASLFRAHLDGRGLVLVSHDVHESWSLATHLHVLVRGAWVISEPKTGTIDGFLGRYREVLHG